MTEPRIPSLRLDPNRVAAFQRDMTNACAALEVASQEAGRRLGVSLAQMTASINRTRP